MSLLKVSAIGTLWLLLAACSSSDSTHTGEPDEETATESTPLAARASAADMCELPSGGYADACNACLAAQCCTPIEACKSDAACAEQLRCIVGCQGDENPAECSMACTREGVHLGYAAYDDCSFVECLSTCWM